MKFHRMDDFHACQVRFYCMGQKSDMVMSPLYGVNSYVHIRQKTLYGENGENIKCHLIIISASLLHLQSSHIVAPTILYTLQGGPKNDKYYQF